MKNLIRAMPIALTMGVLFFLSPGGPVARASDGPMFEYACSVYQKNEKGLFRDVVNVVFLPDWQKKSHTFHDRGLDIWFEVEPVKNFKGDIESYQMVISIHKEDSTEALLRAIAPEQSELGLESEELNIGSRCFHRSQRGRFLSFMSLFETQPLSP